jgi:hypothetical protein
VPFVRFTRDKRGYESTFVMHTARVHGRKRPRLLYWFRTPPGVRVGRTALDRDVLREIETLHPDLEFDWPTLLQQRTVTDAANAPSGGASRREKSAEPPRHEEERREKVAKEPEPEEAIPQGNKVADPSPPHPSLEGLVGVEGVRRLRARYADLIARIDQAVAEQVTSVASTGQDEAPAGERNLPISAAELRREADALDPDRWITTDEARAGLETFEAHFESVRRRLTTLRSRPRQAD